MANFSSDCEVKPAQYAVLQRDLSLGAAGTICLTLFSRDVHCSHFIRRISLSN
jgi:hypothetical protein